MAIVETQANQTKITVILVVVLLSTVGITLFRIKPDKRAAAPSEEKCANSASVEAGSLKPVDLLSSRNPFLAPDSLLETEEQQMEDAAVLDEDRFRQISRANTQGPRHTQNSNATDTLSSTLPFFFPQPQKSISESPRTLPKPPPPNFTLLATVSDGQGFSAVIKTSESSPRVVEVGDRLESGYIVKSVEPTRVVLTDGSDIAIARRPRH